MFIPCSASTHQPDMLESTRVCDAAQKGRNREIPDLWSASLFFRVRSSGHLNLLPAYFDHPENRADRRRVPRPSFGFAQEGRKRSIGQLRIESKAVRVAAFLSLVRAPQFHTRISSLLPTSTREYPLCDLRSRTFASFYQNILSFFISLNISALVSFLLYECSAKRCMCQKQKFENDFMIIKVLFIYKIQNYVPKLTFYVGMVFYIISQYFYFNILNCLYFHTVHCVISGRNYIFFKSEKCTFLIKIFKRVKFQCYFKFKELFKVSKDKTFEFYHSHPKMKF